jgi:antirestriction protein ArdC
MHQMSQTFHQPRSGENRVSIYDEVTARVIAEMEQGRVPWVKPWKDSGVALGLPRNTSTTRHYSGINILILWGAVMRHGFATQEWVTLRQCNELGGRIKKGERGTTACYADSYIPKAERERAAKAGDDPNRVAFLKRFTLFNLEQCEGLPSHIAPSAPPHPDSDVWRRCNALIAATGAIIHEGGDKAFYNPREDFIRIPLASSFISDEDNIATRYHELTHWTSHPTRLSRDLGKRFGDTGYAREELVAELGSAFLCAMFGIVPRVRHADYLAHWLGVLKQDSKAIFQAASAASKACDFILACQADAAGQAA